MILIHCPESDPASLRVLKTVQESLEGARSRSWSAFSRMVPRSTCLIVILERLEGEHFHRLQEHRNRHPSQPIVLITRGEKGNARQLKDIDVEEVVWFSDVPSGIERAVRSACSRHFLLELGSAIRQANHLSEELRAGLAFLCESPRPVFDQTEMARAAGCDRTTLWRLWRSHAGEDMSLKRFLDWMFMVRAVLMLERGASLKEIALEAGVSEVTLRRAPHRTVGRNLNSLPASERQRAVGNFVRQVYRILTLDGVPPRISS